jgi:hypothetical protein
MVHFLVGLPAMVILGVRLPVLAESAVDLFDDFSQPSVLLSNDLGTAKKAGKVQSSS